MWTGLQTQSSAGPPSSVQTQPRNEHVDWVCKPSPALGLEILLKKIYKKVFTMNNILNSYYRGIFQQLQSEVNFINSIFTHQGIKGEGNEIILRDLIKKFIPKKYGVGTGIVVDKNGKQSKQIDIIIYDQDHYPSILSLASVHLFPVDIVYAVIEVKTSLDSKSADQAIKNIASVRSLEIVRGKYIKPDSSQDGSLALKQYSSNHPRGIIFSYKSSAESFETFHNWFMFKDGSSQYTHPSIITSLDQGIVYSLNPDLSEGSKMIGNILPLNDGCDQAIQMKEKNSEYYEKDGIKYPIIKSTTHNCYYPVDQSRILLMFLLLLSDKILGTKSINPSVNFFDNYFSSFRSNLLRIELD
jgi:hypothetical protein